MTNINILIPGGEIALIPAGTYTDKNGSIRPSPARAWVTFGKNSSPFRADQLKALYNEITNNSVIREFLDV